MEPGPDLDAVLAADAVAVLPPAMAPRPLPPAGIDPAEVAAAKVVSPRSGTVTVDELLRRHGARGLAVVTRGRLAFEWFAGEPDRSPPPAVPAGGGRRRPCFSVTKSFTGTLVALAVHDGVLDRDALVGDIVPELAASGFGGATVGQVADMTASVAYTEDYDDGGRPPGAVDGGTFGFNDYLAALQPGGPWTLREWLARIGPGPRPHGEAFDYATPKTDVLGWVLETVRGRPYLDLLRETVWDHVGATRAGALAFDRAGTPMAGAGLTMTTHDLARAGLALLERVPPAVLAGMRSGGSPEAFARSHYNYLDGYVYADQWWLPGPDRPLTAWGIHGQLLWLDPDAEVVIACHSADASPSDEDRDLDHDALGRALTALLQ
jgi:CubicO group peptidase (beta-lactamase class C family)